jgi:polar amino acid transport system permease protein
VTLASSTTTELLAQGAAVTVVITLITSVLALGVGVVVGSLRLAPQRLVRLGATVFVEVFRNIPALIQIIFWVFAVPSVFPDDLRARVFFDNALMDGLSSLTGLALPYYAIGAGIALVLNTGAHLAELFRSGLSTLPREHVEAARSLGAGRATVFRSVLLPDGLRAAWPAIGTRLVHNLKNTALVSFVAVPDLFHAMQEGISRTFRASDLLLTTAAIYLALSALMGLALDLIGRRLHRGRTPIHG